MPILPMTQHSSLALAGLISRIHTRKITGDKAPARRDHGQGCPYPAWGIPMGPYGAPWPIIGSFFIFLYFFNLFFIFLYFLQNCLVFSLKIVDFLYKIL